jgi:hypothetical protein
MNFAFQSGAASFEVPQYLYPQKEQTYSLRLDDQKSQIGKLRTDKIFFNTLTNR